MKPEEEFLLLQVANVREDADCTLGLVLALAAALSEATRQRALERQYRREGFERSLAVIKGLRAELAAVSKPEKERAAIDEILANANR